MIRTASYKSKQFLTLTIKLFIVIGCSYFIYDKLYNNQQLDFEAFYSNSTKNNLFSLKNVSFLFFFSIVNWSLEIKKWQLLANQISNISFSEALKQSLASLTASLITPNRIGEYGAKAIYFAKSKRKQVLLLNLIGNLYQLTTTVLFGVIGLTFFCQNFSLPRQLNSSLFYIGLVLLLIIIAWHILKKNVSFKEYSFQSIIQFTKDISKTSKLKIGILSIARYIIFTHQFYFLLFIFNVDISYSEALCSIFTMYLLASIIPMLSLFDVVIKSSVAIWVFGFFNTNELNILTIVMIMWIYNFVLPSLLGSYYVLTFKSPKIIQTE
jgi:hypothetical protein